MRKIFETVGFSYDELNEKAKSRVKDWYLDATESITAEEIGRAIMDELEADFPSSKFSVQFSLTSCQGDGLNIFGEVQLFEYLHLWQGDTDSKEKIGLYLSQSGKETFQFSHGSRYAFSRKFIDREEIEYVTEEIAEGCEVNVDRELVSRFLNELVDYFEKLDSKFEKWGYELLYNIEDDELEETCLANEWFFTEEGSFIA